MIEWKQSPFRNQLMPKRSDSWATVFQGDLISKYALYHPTHGKARPGGWKILFHEYAAKLINPENSAPPPPPRSFLTKFALLPQDCKAWKHMEVECWHHWKPHECLSLAERRKGGGGQR